MRSLNHLSGLNYKSTCAIMLVGLLTGCGTTINRETPISQATSASQPKFFGTKKKQPTLPLRHQGPLLAPTRTGVVNAVLSKPSNSGGWGARNVAFGGASVNQPLEETITLNLVDAPIRVAAETILGRLYDANIVVDPELSGTITITSPKPVSTRTAIETLELALAQNNARILNHGSMVEIARISDVAGASGLGATRSATPSPGYSVRIVPLDFIGAKEMATILTPLAGEGILAVDSNRNLLVMAGNSTDHRAWQQTIDSFDVNWLANRAIGLFPIVGRPAATLIHTLERYVSPFGEGEEQTGEPLAYFEVIPDNNAILAVARNHEALLSVASMIDRVTAQTQNDSQLFVYDMRYGKAIEVAGTLADVFDAELKSGNGSETNTISSETSLSSGENIAELTLSTSQDTPGPSGSGIKIVPNEATNALLIRATPGQWSEIVTVLEQIDIPQRQVLVEATILEVTLNDTLRYGVQYFLEFGGGTGAGSALLTAAGSAIAPQLPGLALSALGNPSVVIDALDDVTRVNVISSPNMMVLNNQSARLIVGDQVPVATRQAEDATENNEVFASTVEFRDTGIIFEVTPRITSTGSVEIDVRQEVSTVSAASADTLTPTISQRVLQSAVSVETGETIVLGGLFSDRTTGGRSGIPGLVDVPGIGSLFGRRNEQSMRTELVVLLTPQIVTNSFDARNITRKIRERLSPFGQRRATLSTISQFPALGRRVSDIVK